jgi:hypothetical protein
MVPRILLPPVVAALTWVAVFASCGGSDPHPPDLGDCKSSGAVCTATVVGGGVSGGDDAGGAGGACSATAADSMCDQCAAGSCCTSFEACENDIDCKNLLSCEQPCTSSSCITNCQMQAPNGVALLTNLDNCLTAMCPVCSELGIGDSCVSGAACLAGLSCSGLWCTKPCARASDCIGLGAAGGNVLGLPNACILTTSNGDECVPGCQSDADCAGFPGTFCFVTQSVDALSVSVCAPMADAGTGAGG